MSCQLSAWLRTPPAAVLHYNYNIVKSLQRISIFLELKFTEDNAFKVFRKFLFLLIFLIVNVACKSNNDGVVGNCMCLYLFNRLSIFLYFSTILCHIFHIISTHV